MLIQQKLESLKTLTSNEKIVASYLLEKKDHIKHLSIEDISKSTFTSLSTTVRMAQKLGYTGWKELREAFYEEQEYLKTHFKEIDANVPFDKNDSIQSIVGKISSLLTDSIYDTASILKHDDLQKAVKFIATAKKVYIFAVANIAASTYDFKYKMRFISRKVEIIDNPEDFVFALRDSDENTCCLFISYSGETFELFRLTPYLKKRKFSAISITSIGENSLKLHTDCNLEISTRERLYSKIGNYVSNESVHYILDVLYSCIFSTDYDYNWKVKLSMGKEIDKDRYSSVSILQENDN